MERVESEGSRPTDASRVHILISGLVQGVFFRAFARDEARELGVYGWVRNRADGKVEVMAEGSQADLKKLVAWCHRGPDTARVDYVDSQWEAYRCEFQRFEVR